MSADDTRDEEQTAETTDAAGSDSVEPAALESAENSAEEATALETLTADVVVPAVSDEGDPRAEESDPEATSTASTVSEDDGEAIATAGGDAELSAAADSAESGESTALTDAEQLPQRTAEIKSIVEALIFASPDPLTLKALSKLLDAEPKEDVAAAVAALREDYERPSGLQFVEVAGGYQIVTRPDLNEWVRRLFHERSTQKLSVQALETLAVVAYRQPVTAIEITEIRGVNTSGVMNTLLERHLIKIVGRKQVVGRPFMYATTKEFLIRFGLKDIGDLPKVEDMAEALGIENPLLFEHSPVDEQLPLEEPDEESAASDAAAADTVAGDDDDDDLGDEPSGSVH